MAVLIPNKLYFKIGEVSKITGIEPYILRYWESEFKIVKPYRTKSNQRLYRKKDVEVILRIKKMLYEEKFTIAGAKRKLKEGHAKEKQLSINFSQKKYVETLNEIKEEIKLLRDMLSKNPSV
jgi:DNA-binding transcriptional MerR regulator